MINTATPSEECKDATITPPSLKGNEFMQTMFQQVLNFAANASLPELDQLTEFFRANLQIITGIKHVKELSLKPHATVTMQLESHTISLNEPTFQRDHPPIQAEKSNPSSHPEPKATPSIQKKPLADSKKTEKQTQPQNPENSTPSETPTKGNKSEASESVPLSPFTPHFDDSPLETFARFLPKTPKNQRMKFLVVVDSIEFRLFGACKKCTKDFSECAACKLKGGIRAIMDGFLFSEEALQVVIWTDQVLELLPLSKADIFGSLRDNPDHVRKLFLDTYRGHLLYLEGYYKAYRGDMGFNVTKITPKTWSSLVAPPAATPSPK